MSPLQEASNWLSFVQMLMFCFGMFTARSSLFHSIKWNENMPWLCRRSIQICCFVFPPIIIVCSIYTLIIEGMQVSQMTFLLLQVGLFVWYFYSLYPELEKHHEKCL